MKRWKKNLFLFFALSALVLPTFGVFAEEEGGNTPTDPETPEVTPTPDPTDDPTTPEESPEPTPSEPPVVQSDGYLKSLSVAGVKFDQTFQKTVTEYSAVVTSKTTSINISAVPEVETDTIDSSEIGFQNLKSGLNTFEIHVKTKEGKTTTYTLKITRATSNMKLKSLRIVGQNLNQMFDPDTYEYTADVTYNVQSIKVQATPEDDNATVTVLGSSDLDVGRNTVRVLVKNQSGESVEYTIIVTRGSEEDLMEDDDEGVTSSEVEESDSSVVPPIDDVDDPGKGNTLTYVLVCLLCLLLLAIGIIGIYFYVKSGNKSEKRKQKKLEKLQRKQQKIEQEMTGLLPKIPEEEAVENNLSEEENGSNLEADLDDTIEMDTVNLEEEEDIKPKKEEAKKRADRNVLEDFDDLFLDE